MDLLSWDKKESLMATTNKTLSEQVTFVEGEEDETPNEGNFLFMQTTAVVGS